MSRLLLKGFPQDRTSCLPLTHLSAFLCFFFFLLQFAGFVLTFDKVRLSWTVLLGDLHFKSVFLSYSATINTSTFIGNHKPIQTASRSIISVKSKVREQVRTLLSRGGTFSFHCFIYLVAPLSPCNSRGRGCPKRGAWPCTPRLQPRPPVTHPGTA